VELMWFSRHGNLPVIHLEDAIGSPFAMERRDKEAPDNGWS